MQKRRVLFSAITLVLLLCTATTVYASYATSILYIKFNDEIWKNYQLDKQYTTVTIDVKNYLTYNATTGGDPSAKVAFTNDTGDTPEGIQLLFKKSGTLEVWKIEGLTEVKLASSKWDVSDITRITLSGQKLSVWASYNTNKTAILKDFSYGNYFEYLRVKGGGSYIATDGYVQVNVNSGAAGTSAIINQWIPIIVTFVCLSIVLAYVKKIGS
ncbi:MAG: hypothetical protein QXU99_07715 [Candidatus Bathyarchaeia archaeon]